MIRLILLQQRKAFNLYFVLNQNNYNLNLKTYEQLNEKRNARPSNSSIFEILGIKYTFQKEFLDPTKARIHNLLHL